MALSAPFIGRRLVRNIPFAAQNTRVENLPALASFVAEFDVALVPTDPNQLLAGAPVGAGIVQHAIGPFLDILIFSPAATNLLIDYAVDGGASYRNISTTPIPANTPQNVSGLRITGRFVRVTFTDTSNTANIVEFGAYVRST